MIKLLGADQLLVSVYVQPGAKSSQIVGVHAAAIKVQLQAPAQENRANQALIKFFAQLCGLRLQQVELVAGSKSRHKRLLIYAAAVTCQQLIEQALVRSLNRGKD